VILAHKDHPEPLLRPETTLRRADVTFSPSQFLATVAGTRPFLRCQRRSLLWVAARLAGWNAEAAEPSAEHAAPSAERGGWQGGGPDEVGWEKWPSSN
jgi:hypothetical protein